MSYFNLSSLHFSLVTSFQSFMKHDSLRYTIAISEMLKLHLQICGTAIGLFLRTVFSLLSKCYSIWLMNSSLVATVLGSRRMLWRYCLVCYSRSALWPIWYPCQISVVLHLNPLSCLKPCWMKIVLLMSLYWWVCSLYNVCSKGRIFSVV